MDQNVGRLLIPAADHADLHKAVVQELQAALHEGGGVDEKALAQAVKCLQGVRVKPGTWLLVSISEGLLHGTTPGGKKFTGLHAGKASGIGTGYLVKNSSTIYTDTTSYEFKQGLAFAFIYFYNASHHKLGTWIGKLCPCGTVGEFSGPGEWWCGV